MRQRLWSPMSNSRSIFLSVTSSRTKFLNFHEFTVDISKFHELPNKIFNFHEFTADFSSFHESRTIFSFSRHQDQFNFNKEWLIIDLFLQLSTKIMKTIIFIAHQGSQRGRVRTRWTDRRTLRHMDESGHFKVVCSQRDRNWSVQVGRIQLR